MNTFKYQLSVFYLLMTKITYFTLVHLKKVKSLFLFIFKLETRNIFVLKNNIYRLAKNNVSLFSLFMS